MSRVRTGYAGRDRRGRPTGPQSLDQGPAAARSVNGLAAIGRVSASRGVSILDRDVSHAGAGEVTRRQATTEERAAWQARDDQLSPLRLAMPRPIRPLPAPAPEPAPVTKVPSQPEEQPMAAVAPLAPPASLEVPCRTCLHEPVCALKASIPLSAGVAAPITTSLRDGLRMYVTAFTIECDYHLADPAHKVSADSPSDAERMAASRIRGTERSIEVRRASIEELGPKRHPSSASEPDEKEARRIRVLEAMDRFDGDASKAAIAIGMRPNAFAMVLKHARRTTESEAVPA